jgi:hypothetical protein
MERFLHVVLWGVAGVVLAASLSLGAFALAGRTIAAPAQALRIEPVGDLAPSSSDAQGRAPHPQVSHASPGKEPSDSPAVRPTVTAAPSGSREPQPGDSSSQDDAGRKPSGGGSPSDGGGGDD